MKSYLTKKQSLEFMTFSTAASSCNFTAEMGMLSGK